MSNVSRPSISCLDSVASCMCLAVFYCILGATIAASGNQFGSNSFTEYRPGTLNLIISSPHGGSLKPNSIADRDVGFWDGSKCIWTHGCTEGDPQVNQDKCEANILKDLYTQEIALFLASSIQNFTGKHPHVVLNHLHRVKLDPNREKDEATFGEDDAITAYNDFHQFIEKAKTKINQSADSYGLLLDIHGHTHPENMVELGYTVIKDRLNGKDGMIPLAIYSSIRTLADRVQVDFETILRGNKSLGYYIEQEGHATVPSLAHPSPGSAKYFTGGYITKTHGSRNGGIIDAVQIEAPKPVRDSENGKDFANSLASAVKRFMHEYYPSNTLDITTIKSDAESDDNGNDITTTTSNEEVTNNTTSQNSVGSFGLNWSLICVLLIISLNT